MKSKVMASLIILTFVVVGTSCTTLVDTDEKAKSEISNLQEQVASQNIGIARNVQVIWTLNTKHPYCIDVLIEPINAEANKVYTVSLYEKGKFRKASTVSWNQPEINVKKPKEVLFDATIEEWHAYFAEGDLSFIFDVKIIANSEFNSQPDFKLERLSIEPQRVKANESVTITIWQINEDINGTGGMISLMINGQLERIRTVKSCPRQNNPSGCRISFIVKKIIPGVYTVDIGKEHGIFIVE